MKVATMKNIDGATCLCYFLKVKNPLLFYAIYVQPIKQQYDQELFEMHLCNQSSHYEIYR